MNATTKLDYRAVEQFLYREARLADENLMEEWVALWDEDALYWVPCNKDDVDPTRELSIIYDDLPRLKLRVARVTKTAMAWTQEPRSRNRRLVSNIEIRLGEDGLVHTRSNFHLTELRANRREPVVWVGATEHRLRAHGNDFRIAYKKVLLLNNDHEMPQLSVLV